MILAEVRSAGQAMGFLQRLRSGELAGVLLDHDLHQQAITTRDLQLSGSSLVDFITRFVDRDVAVLIHSQNPASAASMMERLKSSGFWVSRRPMDSLTPEFFHRWIDEVRAIWEDN